VFLAPSCSDLGESLPTINLLGVYLEELACKTSTGFDPPLKMHFKGQVGGDPSWVQEAVEEPKAILGGRGSSGGHAPHPACRLLLLLHSCIAESAVKPDQLPGRLRVGEEGRGANRTLMG